MKFTTAPEGDTSTTLTVPAGVSTKPDLVIDLYAILASEARQDEVAFVTPTKAPELLTALNRSWREIHEIVSRLEAEKNKAEQTAEKRKGILLLEVIPKRLAELNIASAADTRKAVIDTDVEYEGLRDRFDQLCAAIVFLKGKLKSFENAYASVKKIMGEDSYNMAAKPNGRLSGDTTARPPLPSYAKPAPAAEPTTTTTSPYDAGASRPARGGFGASRY